MRTLLAVALLFAGGCFDPRIPESLRCGTGDSCPSNHTCVGEVCVLGGGDPDGGAGAPDGPIILDDGGTLPTPDAGPDPDGEAGSWSAPARVDSASGPAADPRLVAHPSGALTAAWLQNHLTHISVWSARADEAGAWGGAVTIETNDLGHAESVELAALGEDALAVWIQGTSGTDKRVAASRRVAAGAWDATPALLDDSATYVVSEPHVAAGGDPPVAVAVWVDIDGTADLWSARFAGSWSSPVEVELSIGAVTTPRVAVGGASPVATVAWRQMGASVPAIYVSRAPQITSPWSPAEILSNAAAGANSPDLAARSDGNAIVVYREYSMAFSAWYPMVNVWGGGPPTDSVMLDGADTALDPRVVASAGGTAMAAWVSMGDVRASRNDAAWAVAVPLSDTPQLEEELQLAIDDAGNAFAVWAEGGTVFAARYLAGAGWQAPRSLDSPGASSPRVAVTGAGVAMAVWLRNEGGTPRVYASRYQP